MANRFNTMDWLYSKHALDNVRYRALDMREVLIKIVNTELNTKWIFEYYTDKYDKILKVCYRIPYKDNNDIIIVVSNEKCLITVYFNSVNDEHYTLKKEIYNVK